MEGTSPEHKVKIQSENGQINSLSLLSVGEDDNNITNYDCNGLYDRPLSFFGCGIGWFCFMVGFIFPILWYIATVLYLSSKFFNLRDPRERAGLAASAIAALICSVALLITLLAYFL